MTLAIGAAGGGVFFVLALPLPWMLGAMAFATIASLAGAPLAAPRTIRSAMVAVMGVFLGTQFSADIFAHIADWYLGLCGVVLTIVAMVGFGYCAFRKLGGYDPVTAYFSSMPGGLAEMMTLGDAMGGDGRKISLTHGIRILIAVFLIAFYFRIFENQGPVNFPASAGAGFGWTDAVLLLVCALAGYPGARALRIPAAALVGPLFLSALLHLTGVLSSQPPVEPLAAAQVILGAAIGARFVGTKFAELRRTLGLAAFVAVGMVLIAAAVAAAFGAVGSASGATLFLALAPGGLTEMSLIALSLGGAAAFVSTHHIFRIILIVVAGPLIFRAARLYRRR